MAILAAGLPFPIETPLIRQDGLWIKLEGLQRAGSVKYRMVFEKVRAGLSSGEIRPGTTLVEATSGSTGVALAFAGRELGLPVELHVYENASSGKLRRILDLGGRIVRHRLGTPFSAILATIREGVRSGRCWHLRQYDRAGLTVAYEPFAREILRQLPEAPSFFVCPVGTGGVIQGVGRVLRAAFPRITIIAVEPIEGASIDGMRNLRTHHLGEGDPYDRQFPDGTEYVPAPRTPVCLGGVVLGESATATIELVRSKGWKNVLIVAADHVPATEELDPRGANGERR